MKQGTLYGLSLGPGDPGLITRRAWELLQGEAIWAYPVRRKGEASYALGIVQRAGLSVPESAIALPFPMTSDAETLARHWLDAAQQVLQALNASPETLMMELQKRQVLLEQKDKEIQYLKEIISLLKKTDAPEHVQGTETST